jgi:hypothetical protein
MMLSSLVIPVRCSTRSGCHCWLKPYADYGAVGDGRCRHGSPKENFQLREALTVSDRVAATSFATSHYWLKLGLALVLSLRLLYVFYLGLFMRAKRVHGIHSITSYNRTIDNHTRRRERSEPA